MVAAELVAEVWGWDGQAEMRRSYKGREGGVHLVTWGTSFGWSPYEGTYFWTRIPAASVACKMSICEKSLDTKSQR